MGDVLDGDGGDPGLVNGRISADSLIDVLRRVDRKPRATLVALPGGLVVGAHRVAAVEGKGGGRRGKVCGLSRASHKRMLQRLMSVDWDAQAVYFVTLTYHEMFGDWQSWKQDLRIWGQRLKYEYEDVRGVIWKLEMARRKTGLHKGEFAPHFHLAIFWSDIDGCDLKDLRQFVSRTWNAVVDPGDLEHLQAGTGVEKAHNTCGDDMGKLLSYLSKYLGKIDKYVVRDSETGEDLPTGRIWGVWGELPTRVLATVNMTWGAYIELTARIRDSAKGKGSWYLSNVSENWDGFRIYGDGGLLLKRLVSGIQGVKYV